MIKNDQGMLNLGLIRYRQSRGYHGSEIGRDGDIDSLIQEVEWLRDKCLHEKHVFISHIKGLEDTKKKLEAENAKLRTASVVLSILAEVSQEEKQAYELKIAELKAESKNKRDQNRYGQTVAG